MGQVKKKPKRQQVPADIVQIANLKMSEEIGAGLPTLDKVPAAQALTYELIQFVNAQIGGKGG